ncbi:unnamed protein product [marine sediment metagenome]|uniref:Uncharacterized protein n=1 Tax=marine sediment metagenome TaxID=412755 RepID=X0WUG5_9ZZZZ
MVIGPELRPHSYIATAKGRFLGAVRELARWWTKVAGRHVPKVGVESLDELRVGLSRHLPDPGPMLNCV